MPTTLHVSLEEYLNTDYEPDCDYVDGVLEERNVGEKKHGRTQGRLYTWLVSKAPDHGYEVLLEQRIQISHSRVRIPDICLVPENADEVVREPPALWVEILSPEDRFSRVQTRLKDCLRFGVPTIWIIDPYSREAWVLTPETLITQVEDGILRCANPNLEVALSDILPEE